MPTKSRQLKDGTLVVEAYSKAHGRSKYLGSYPNKREAQDAIDDWRAKVRDFDRKRAAGEAPAPLVARTYAKAAAEWLEYLETPGVSGHRSRGKYEAQLRLHILPWFGKRAITEITSEAVDEWLVSLTSKGGQQSGRVGKLLSPQTANTIRICLSASFAWMVNPKRWLQVNPVGGTTELTAERREFQWIHNPDDITRLLGACSEELRDFVGLLVGTGLRMGELLSLHWSDVNLDARQLRVRSGGRGKTAHETKPTKTGKARSVPLLDTALTLLKARRLRCGGKGFVFASPQGGGIRNMSAFRSAFDTAVDAAGIHRDGMPKIRVHDLRHTFACHWVSSGGDIYRLSKVLGHATVRTTEEYYADFRTESYAQDYHRVSFSLPTTTDNVLKLRAVDA